MNPLLPVVDHRIFIHQRAQVLKNLDGEAKEQREIINLIIKKILSNEDSSNECKNLIQEFNPSLLPLNAMPFYCLETAIKVGKLELVSEVFSRYKNTMSDWKELMRQSLYMEIPYRPIFWLAGVCTSSNVEKFTDRPGATYKDYFEIIEFMEKELDLLPNHMHLTPYKTFSYSEYIKAFNKDPAKREALLGMRLGALPRILDNQ